MQIVNQQSNTINPRNRRATLEITLLGCGIAKLPTLSDTPAPAAAPESSGGQQSILLRLRRNEIECGFSFGESTIACELNDELERVSLKIEAAISRYPFSHFFMNESSEG